MAKTNRLITRSLAAAVAVGVLSAGGAGTALAATQTSDTVTTSLSQSTDLGPIGDLLGDILGEGVLDLEAGINIGSVAAGSSEELAVVTLAELEALDGVVPANVSIDLINSEDWITLSTEDALTLTVSPGVDVEPGVYDIDIDVDLGIGTPESILLQVTVTEPVDTDGDENAGETGTVDNPTNPADPDVDSLAEAADAVDLLIGSDDGVEVRPGSVISGDILTASTSEILPTSVEADAPAGWYGEGEGWSWAFKVAEDAEVGSYTELFYNLTFEDGSTDTVRVGVVVNAEAPDYQADHIDPVLPNEGKVEVAAGTSVSLDPIVDAEGEALPEGTTFQSDNDQDWIEVSEEGVVTFSPSADAELGEYEYTITVTYADGSTDELHGEVTVTAATANGPAQLANTGAGVIGLAFAGLASAAGGAVGLLRRR